MKLYNYTPASIKHPQRCPHAPQTPTRILICGSSGCGKTNLLLNLIYDILPWSNLYVFAKDCEESKYAQLKEVCQKTIENDPDFKYHIGPDLNMTVDKMNPKEHNLVIFDDFITDRLSMPTITDFFIRGRKKNCTLIFVTQAYFDTPKTLRLQCQYYCLFALSDGREISELHRTYMGHMPLVEFRRIFRQATEKPHNFLTVDLPRQTLRQNFDQDLLNIK